MDLRTLLLVSAPVLLVAACGGSPAGHPAASSHVSQALAFARCMRAHGVPRFPDPDQQGNFPSFDTDVSKRVSSAANETCKHLMSSGGTATPQQRQQKFLFATKVAECLRSHGYPDFPDPSLSGGQRTPPGLDTSSPQFQTVETACEKQEQKAVGLP